MATRSLASQWVDMISNFMVILESNSGTQTGRTCAPVVNSVGQ